MRFYLLYKNHGLYDPVLDDTEYIYVPIDSQELEINDVKCETNQRPETIVEHFGKNGAIKEPLNVPELDDKNISKAFFHKALLDIGAGDLPESARFKLPISEEYDPEGKKMTKLQKMYAKKVADVDLKTITEKIKQNECKAAENLLDACKYTLSVELNSATVDEMTKNESQYSQLKKEDVNLENLKKTASRIVGDSIDRAVSIAREIKHEVNVELEKMKTHKNISEMGKESLHKDSKKFEQLATEKPISTKKEYDMGYAAENKTNVRKDDFTNEPDEDKLNVAEEIKKFESLKAPMDSKVNLEERKQLAKQDVKETIEEGTVRRRSEIFAKEINMSKNIVKKTDISSEILSKSFDQHKTIPTSYFEKNTQIHDNAIKQTEQRAFTLGAQTVPHLRQALLSSYNSNLLLKTFFLQLTKVMLALSKILTLEETRTCSPHSEKIIKIENNVENIKQEDKRGTIQEEKIENAESSKKHYSETLNSIDDNYEGDIIKKKKLSGAEIAQIEGNKPAELTDKMDIVISELLEKTVLEDHSSNQDFFRKSSQASSVHKVEENNKDNFNNTNAQHDFFDQRSKHFDRRKLFEILEERTKTMNIKEMISEKRTTEYKSMRTNKQNENIIYYVALVEAKHFPNFEEMKRTRNLYEHEIKTDIKNDENLVYVAIVEAHANINEEAIYKEQMRRQLEKQLLLDKTMKQTIELEDVQKIKALEVETPKLSFSNTIIVEPVKASLTVTPMPNTPLKFARSATDMEQISKKIAVQNIVQAIEPLLRHASQKFDNKQAASAIEMPTKALAETMDVKAEEQQTFFKAEVSVKQISFVSIENPESVVEITEITTEEDENIPVELAIPIVSEPRHAIEITGKSVAEVSEIQTVEANIEILPEPKVMNKGPSIVLEKPVLSVAETMTAIAEYKSDDIIVPKTVSEKATINVEAKIAAEVSEVSAIEEDYDTLKTEQFLHKQSKILHEPPALIVAETLKTHVSEPKGEFVISKTIDQRANIDFQKQTATDISVVIPEETYHDHLEILKMNEKLSQITSEIHLLSVAETLTVLPQEPKDEALEIFTTVNQKQSEPIIETPSLTVPEYITTSTEGPKENTFTVTEPEKQQVNIDIKELKALMSMITTSEEPKLENIEISVVSKKMAEVLMEKCSLMIAITLAIFLGGPMDGKLDISSVVENQAKVLIETPKLTVAEIINHFLEEPKVNDLKIPQITAERCHIIIQEFISLVKTIIIPLYQCNDLEIQKLEHDMAQICMETQFLCVPLTVAILLGGPKDGILEIPPFITNQVNVLMEMPKNILADILMNCSLGSKEGTFEITDNKQERCNILIEKCLSLIASLEMPLDTYTDLKVVQPQFLIPEIGMESIFLTVASCLAIMLDGPKEDNYEIPTVNTYQAKAVMEMLNLIVPEAKTTLLEGPRESYFNIPEITGEKCDIIFNQYLSLVKSFVILVDQYNMLEIPKINEETPRVTLEQIYMQVAVILTLLTYGPGSEDFEIVKTTTDQAKVTFRQLEAILTSCVDLQESKGQEIEKQVIEEKYPQVAIENCLFVPEYLNIEVQGPKEENINITKPKCEKSFASIIQFKAIEVLAILLSEYINENLKVPQIIKKKSMLSIEDVKLHIANILSVYTEEPKDKPFEIDSKEKHEARVKIEELKAAEVKFMPIEEPEPEEIIISDINKKQIQTSVQSSLTVARKSAVSPMESIDYGVVALKTAKHKASMNVETLKSIETLTTLPEEPEEEFLGTAQAVNKTALCSLVDNNLTTAQTSIVHVEASAKTGLDLKVDKSLKAHVQVEEFKPLETSITNIVEPKSKALEITLLENKHTKELIEKPIKKAAQVTMINTSEFETEINAVGKANTYKHAKLEFESATSVAQQSLTTAMEKTHDVTHEYSLMSKTAKSSIVQSSSTAMAEVKENDTEINLLIEKPKPKTTKIENIEIEANLKIPTSVDDSVNEVSAEYSVIVPQKENVYAEFGFSERKIDVDTVAEIYESIRLMKKRALQKQSMEASLSLAKELQTKIEMVEIEALQEEFIRSGSISSSSSKASSPLTPILEEYFFSIQGPSLMSRYRRFQDVFEEASLKLKSKIQTSTIQNLDASLTLILQDLAMAQFESETNNIEVVEIDDYEDVRNLHFSTALMARSQKQSIASLMSSEGQSLKAIHASSASQSSYGYSMSVEDADLRELSMASRASKSVKFADTAHVDIESSAENQSLEISELEIEANSHRDFNIQITQDAISKRKSKAIESLNMCSVSVENGSMATRLEESRTMEGRSLEVRAVEGAGEMRSSKESTAMELTRANAEQLSIRLKQNVEANSESHKTLSIKTDLKRSEGTDVKSPSPPTVPPTPLTDEYIFRLETQMPGPSEFIPRDCSISPESLEEDIILRGGLIPHIRTTIERILYSPPFVTPPSSPDKTVPVYSKGGGKGGIFKFLS